MARGHDPGLDKARIAQVAARLMVEDGIHDHALAKRKALRQLDLPAGHGLPGNDEIDAAIRDYRALFEPEASDAELLALRQQALRAMIDLDAFQPVLVGGVANGAISGDSDIELEIYLDSSKPFEQFLLREDIAYESRDKAGEAYFLLYDEPADVLVRILPEARFRQAKRTRDDTPSRLNRARLERLLAETGSALARAAKSG
jgi:hypothetical protein